MTNLDWMQITGMFFEISGKKGESSLKKTAKIYYLKVRELVFTPIPVCGNTSSVTRANNNS